MECLSYKGGCSVCERTRVEVLKQELAWAIDKRYQLIINEMLFETAIPLRI